MYTPVFESEFWHIFDLLEEKHMFFRKKLQKSLEVIKKCLPLHSQTKRTGNCGSSSVGRAQPCQGWGREFEPRLPLQKVSRNADLNLEKRSRPQPVRNGRAKISPDGVQSYVSRPCAQGGFFVYIP